MQNNQSIRACNLHRSRSNYAKKESTIYIAIAAHSAQFKKKRPDVSQRKGQLGAPPPLSRVFGADVPSLTFVIEPTPSRAPPRFPLSPHLFFLLLRSPYSRGPYLCVQSDGMLAKQQSIHGDADAYTVLEQTPFAPVDPRIGPGPRRADRASSNSRSSGLQLASEASLGVV